MMLEKISNEQKAHDLAVAYALYLSNIEGSKVDIEPFYENYENSYDYFLNLIKRKG